MVKFTVVVREAGKVKPDYSLDFEAPMLPRVGDYLSIQRPDHPRPFGEDMIVAKIWWRLFHPETGGFGKDPPKVGTFDEVFVECVPAVSPYSSDQWRRSLEHANAPEFEVERFSVSESQIAEATRGYS
ncbi:hypothetical protein IC614_08400 [Allosphingosinicella flava]|uniref:Uncharacterized protein n=1 Tax=Allosphingosinicella flava TaxID=2771430 RepID=A0A7T2GI99_9SPHN|nr:hypothetical protein [Sphingosinicella flava]QPQ54372.1 hypothetical protein IC614_08400 [Sphingosinicella flava]